MTEYTYWKNPNEPGPVQRRTKTEFGDYGRAEYLDSVGSLASHEWVESPDFILARDFKNFGYVEVEPNA